MRGVDHVQRFKYEGTDVDPKHATNEEQKYKIKQRTQLGSTIQCQTTNQLRPKVTANNTKGVVAILHGRVGLT